MTSPTPVAYVFYGQDEPALRDKLNSFIAKLGPSSALDLNTTRLDGKSVSLNEINAAARSLPFMSDVRLVLVENMTTSAAGRSLIEDLPALIEGLPEWARLVFVETATAGDDEGEKGRGSAIKKLVNVVENDQRGMVTLFGPPQDLPKWLQERAKKYDARLDGGAARALAERLGGDLVLADSEIAKLATYAGERPITLEDVNLLTPYAAEASIFHMVDALGGRKGDIALRLLRRLLDDGDDPLRVFGMITRQFRLLLQMREHLDSGRTPASATGVLGVRDFVATKLAEQTRPYKMQHLERVFEILLETDIAIKTGRIDPVLALEQLVVRLAGRG
jgi:DNA polymerase-3 subunit delta